MHRVVALADERTGEEDVEWFVPRGGRLASSAGTSGALPGLLARNGTATIPRKLPLLNVATLPAPRAPTNARRADAAVALPFCLRYLRCRSSAFPYACMGVYTYSSLGIYQATYGGVHILSIWTSLRAGLP